MLRAVTGNKDAWAFRGPVDERHAPNYYQLISSPMDLGTMIIKAEQRVYLNIASLERDFVLMVTNCQAYNGPTSQYTIYAYNLWKAFRRGVKIHLGLSLTTNEQQAFLYPLPLYPGPSQRNRKRRARLMHQRIRTSALQALFQAQESAIQDTFVKSATESSLTRTNLLTNTHVLHETQQENLIFKSLQEWGQYIESSGRQIVLPEQAVTVVESPVSSNWLTNYPDEQHSNYSAVLFAQLSQHRGTRRKHQDTSSLASIDSGNSSPATSADEPVTKRSVEILDKQNSPRIVLKLSRKDNDWKPMVVLCDEQIDFLSSGNGSSCESSPAESDKANRESDPEIDGELEKAASQCHLEDESDFHSTSTTSNSKNTRAFGPNSSYSNERLISFCH